MANIIEQYQTLSDAGRWNEALSTIQDIIDRAPYISTSWFNYGVCLDELGRYREAADAFEKAYELDSEDFGAQYRMFRSLHLAQDYVRFEQMLRRECNRYPDIIEPFLNDPDFGPLFARSPLKELKAEFE
jgi:tetratricopeptide (TPR) repeat protein